MRRRSRMRRIAKWVGLALCSLLAALLMYSSPWMKGGHAWGLNSINTVIAVFDGGILAVRFEQPAVLPDESHVASFAAASINRAIPLSYEFVWWPVTDPFVGIIAVFVPLWIPLGLFLVPTAFLWSRDRRRIPFGHCQKCGYDLTGNVSGVCPECGATAAKKGDAA